jgi:hypothetical protein
MPRSANRKIGNPAEVKLETNSKSAHCQFILAALGERSHSSVGLSTSPRAHYATRHQPMAQDGRILNSLLMNPQSASFIFNFADINMYLSTSLSTSRLAVFHQ